MAKNRNYNKPSNKNFNNETVGINELNLKDNNLEVKEESDNINFAEKDEIKQERVPTKSKVQGVVILILKNGCIVRINKKDTRAFYGKEYKNKKVGDILEIEI